MKIAQKISLLGLKKYLRDESQQSLITAYIKLLKKISQNQSDKCENFRICALYQLLSKNTKFNAQNT